MATKKSSNTRSKTQKGGTVLGLIIGLIIGLGIALAVALTVTKTGLPFINKGAQPKAAEGRGGNGAIAVDPNSPLYGNKDAAREAARNVLKPAAAPPGSAETMPEPLPPTASKPAAASDKAPIVEKSAAEPAAKADAGEEKYTYYLQAGAFREQADADSIRGKLALLGFEARVSERLSDSGTLYRVRVGPFGKIETMNRIREKLSENGIDVAVVRSPK